MDGWQDWKLEWVGLKGQKCDLVRQIEGFLRRFAEIFEHELCIIPEIQPPRIHPPVYNPPQHRQHLTTFKVPGSFSVVMLCGV